MITVGSICTGYGGLELALHQAGIPHRLAWTSEIDPYASHVIANRFDAPNLGDINHADPPPVDLITAGFPCQDISVAGRQAGLNGHRSGLWWRICDVIGHLRPRFVLLENVAAIVTTGGPEVVGSLTAMGYDTRWGIVRAADVGAPHRRARWFCLADTDGSRLERSQRASRQWGNRRPAERATTDTDGPSRAEPVADTRRSATPITPPNHRFTFGRSTQRVTTDTVSGRWAGRTRTQGRQPSRRTVTRGFSESVDFGKYGGAIRQWEQLTRPAPHPTTNGRLNPGFVEWMMGLPAGWVTDLDLSRTQQLKMLGNGVVPQQAALAIRLLTEG